MWRQGAAFVQAGLCAASHGPRQQNAICSVCDCDLYQEKDPSTRAQMAVQCRLILYLAIPQIIKATVSEVATKTDVKE